MTLIEALQLAYQHYTNGRFAEAEFIYRDVLQKVPRELNALSNMGQVAARTGRMDEAIQLTQEAIKVDPTLPHLHTAVAEMLLAKHRYQEAVDALQVATRLNPKSANDYLNLAYVLHTSRRFVASGEAAEQAIRLDPSNALAHNVLGCAHLEMHRGHDAAREFEAAAALDGELHLPHMNMPLARLLQGRHAEAFALQRDELEKQPLNAAFASKFLFTTHYYCDLQAQEIAAEHLHWGKVIEANVSRPEFYRNTKEPGRQLRIGYVSGDFRQHVVEYFIEPILLHHDRSQFHLTSYYVHPTSDVSTERLRTHFDRWRDIFTLTDQAAAKLIEEDQIDILIDLSVHSSGNRLGIFARKPAPVQITYLGYPGATGLPSMDYRISAAGMSSPELVEGPEQLLVLPGCYFCYQMPKGIPPVAPPPAEKNGFVTFGSFNRLSKMSDRCLARWSKLLNQLPSAKLRLQNLEFQDPTVQQRTVDRIVAHGVDAYRIRPNLPDEIHDYLSAHHKVDIILDTFPVNGGAASLHALAMGVPVVSLAGSREVSRLGFNILHTIGLDELVTESEDDWLRLASDLAKDIPRLKKLRQGLRQRMEASPLVDGAQFTNELEKLFREAWVRWVHKA